MILLAIDTAASLCAASIHDAERGELARAVRDLGKGHAEHLIAIVDEALAAAGIAYDGLDAVAVSVGPGSFTGVRVGVSAARGLALALGIPAVGVSTLDALAQEARRACPGEPVLAAISAGRGEAYAALYDGSGLCVEGPAAIALEALPGRAAKASVLCGSAVASLPLEVRGGKHVAGEAATADIATYARLGAARLASGAATSRPAPLYLRAADAKPQAGFALPRKEGKA